MSTVKMFHLTGVEFENGDVLEPMDGGYVGLPESQAMEIILERYRPSDKLPRDQSVFLTDKKPKAHAFGAQSSDYLVVCEVPERILEQRSDFNWLAELDVGLEDPAYLEEDFTEDELRYYAEGYWSGEPRDKMMPSYEYRIEEAEVLYCKEMELVNSSIIEEMVY